MATTIKTMQRRAAGAVAATCVAGLLSLPLGFRMAPVAAANKSMSASPLTTDQVVQKMVAMDAARTEALQAYTGVRRYHLDYRGLGHEIADMAVQVSYEGPGPKQFKVISESGSGMLRRQVLDPLLRVEAQEAEIESREGSALVPQNYSFQMVDYPHPGQPDYVLKVKPIRETDRFLYSGKIWLNPVDFGLERVEGESVHSPSWWVTHFEFTYHSQKVGDFWMPASNRCESHIRFFGHAVLSITYDNFSLTSIRPLSYVAAGIPK